MCVCLFYIEHRCTPYSTTQSPAIHLFRSHEVKESRDLQQWRGMIKAPYYTTMYINENIKLASKGCVVVVTEISCGVRGRREYQRWLDTQPISPHE